MLENMTRQQRNRLKRYECFVCEMNLAETVDGDGRCGGTPFSPVRCEAKAIRERALSCLSAAREPKIADTSALTCSPSRPD